MIVRLILIILLFKCANAIGQGVAINSSGLPADSCAILDLNSASRGLLLPRLNTTQRNAIINPKDGLFLFNTTTLCIEFWSNNQWNNLCANNNAPQPSSDWVFYFPQFCNGNVTQVVPVLNPVTGKIWMDRNLGATQAAASPLDTNAFGDLYQWGRRADGHHCRNSISTTILSSSSQPNQGTFIISSGSPFNWQNSFPDPNLWQGVSGINNPCPQGYRIPTQSELESERQSWVTNDAQGAFSSPLKWTLPGYRAHYDGFVYNTNSGFYWSTTIFQGLNRVLNIQSTSAGSSAWLRPADGASIRCIKN
jgi:hypothetical protein